MCRDEGETEREHKPGVALYRAPPSTHTPLPGGWAQEGGGRELERASGCETTTSPTGFL